MKAQTSLRCRAASDFDGLPFIPVLISPPTLVFGAGKKLNVGIFMPLKMRLNYTKQHFWLGSRMRSQLHFRGYIFSIS